MAHKITVALEDDLDGGPADETVRFALGGAEYEIDLSKKNAKTFRKQLAPFIEHARKAGRGQRPRAGRTASSRDRSGGIRAWAKEQGIAVSDRGRIPASVVERSGAGSSQAGAGRAGPPDSSAARRLLWLRRGEAGHHSRPSLVHSRGAERITAWSGCCGADQ